MQSASFEIHPVPPFRLDLTVGALRRRAGNATDRWNGRTYRRACILDGWPIELSVSQLALTGPPTLGVTVSGPMLPAGVEKLAASVVERLLGTSCDLCGFYRFAAGDPVIAPLAERFRGLKPPGLPTLFETLVNAIACQQVSLAFGIGLLNRFVGMCGMPVWHDRESPRAFPEPRDLLVLEPERLGDMGFSRAKARALRELSDAVASGGLDFDAIAGLDDGAVVLRLCELRGVDRWTAEYVMLRGLQRLHVFPGDDVGARNALRRWLGLDEPLDYEGVAHIVERWHPYAGLVYFHLLVSRLRPLDVGATENTPVRRSASTWTGKPDPLGRSPICAEA